MEDYLSEPRDPALSTEEDDQHEVEEERDPELSAPELYEACKSNKTSIAKQLLEAHTPPTYTDVETGWSPLHWTIHHDNVTIARALLSAGAAAPYKKAQAAMSRTPLTPAKSVPQFQGSGRVAASSNGCGSYSSDLVRPTVLSNSPLHWAATRGNLRITWMLLQEGYSPNDLDSTGNTPLHSAAASGHVSAVETLIANGADVHCKNRFKNTPLGVATCEKCRALLRQAAKVSAPPVELQAKLRAANLSKLSAVEQALQDAIDRSLLGYSDTSTSNSSSSSSINRSASDVSRDAPISSVNDTGDLPVVIDTGSAKEPFTGPFVAEQVEALKQAIARADGLCVREELVTEAKQRISCLKLQEHMEVQAEKVRAAEPIITQSAYTSLVNRLSQLMAKGTPAVTAAGVTPNVTDAAVKSSSERGAVPPALLARCQCLVDKSFSEYWLQVATQRVAAVVCAEEEHVRDMQKLDAAIQRAQACSAYTPLVTASAAVLARLQAELEVRRACVEMPTVRLPPVLEEGQKFPKDWWRDEDIGRVSDETEGFPLPPKNEEGVEQEYVWITSSALQRLRAGHARLDKAVQTGAGCGSNEQLLTQAAAKLVAAGKELKILEVKDAEDREKLLAVVVKAAKKLRKAAKGKGKKKKAA